MPALSNMEEIVACGLQSRRSRIASSVYAYLQFTNRSKLQLQISYTHSGHLDLQPSANLILVHLSKVETEIYRPLVYASEMHGML